MLFGEGMPPNLMTSKPHFESDFKWEEWFANGGWKEKHRVRTNDLIEVDETDGAYLLNIQLFWRNQLIETVNRYFASYQKLDGEIEVRLRSVWTDAVFSNGHFSGSCSVQEVSSTQVSVNPDWTLDDGNTRIKTRFNQQFIATLGETGTVDCEQGASMKWSFEAREPAEDFR